jgi:hypothetical protein
MQGGNFLKKSPQKSKNFLKKSAQKSKKSKYPTLRRQKGGGFLKKSPQKGGGCTCESVSKMPHSLGGYFLKSTQKRLFRKKDFLEKSLQKITAHGTRRNQKKTRK